MLRSSEIKPLFVDLSLCDKSFLFYQRLTEWLRILRLIHFFSLFSPVVAYTTPSCVMCECVYYSLVSAYTTSWWLRIPLLGECVYNFLVVAYTTSWWLRIQLLGGCVYHSLVSAYTTSWWLRILLLGGCVYHSLVSAYTTPW